MFAKYEGKSHVLSVPLHPSQRAAHVGQPPDGQSEIVSSKASQMAKAPQLTEPAKKASFQHVSAANQPDRSNVVHVVQSSSILLFRTCATNEAHDARSPKNLRYEWLVSQTRPSNPLSALELRITSNPRETPKQCHLM